jgi:hypothetical protein
MVTIGYIGDRFCNIKAYRHKKFQKKKFKTGLSKLSKTSRIVTVFSVTNDHNAVLLAFTKRSKKRSQCGNG